MSDLKAMISSSLNSYQQEAKEDARKAKIEAENKAKKIEEENRQRQHDFRRSDWEALRNKIENIKVSTMPELLLDNIAKSMGDKSPRGEGRKIHWNLWGRVPVWIALSRKKSVEELLDDRGFVKDQMNLVDFIVIAQYADEQESLSEEGSWVAAILAPHVAQMITHKMHEPFEKQEDVVSFLKKKYGVRG